MKLTDLSAPELAAELKKAGLAISADTFDEREAILRLTTHLIDKGEDPTSYEFTIDASEKESKSTVPEKKDDLAEQKVTARQKLLAKIVKFERNYFTQEGRGL